MEHLKSRFELSEKKAKALECEKVVWGADRQNLKSRVDAANQNTRDLQQVWDKEKRDLESRLELADSTRDKLQTDVQQFGEKNAALVSCLQVLQE